MNLNYIPYIRRPFEIEAVEITEDNIADIAPLVGELCHKDDGSPYIEVDKRLVPNVFKVYPGFYMTRMGDNVRCYSRRVFHEQFVVKTEEMDKLLDAVKVQPRSNKKQRNSANMIPDTRTPVQLKTEIVIKDSDGSVRQIPPPPGPTY